MTDDRDIVGAVLREFGIAGPIPIRVLPAIERLAAALASERDDSNSLEKLLDASDATVRHLRHPMSKAMTAQPLTMGVL